MNPYPNKCLGGCGRDVYPNDDYDLCFKCFDRLRDLVITAAREVVAAAELVLKETVA